MNRKDDFGPEFCREDGPEALEARKTHLAAQAEIQNGWSKPIVGLDIFVEDTCTYTELMDASARFIVMELKDKRAEEVCQSEVEAAVPLIGERPGVSAVFTRLAASKHRDLEHEEELRDALGACPDQWAQARRLSDLDAQVAGREF